MRLAALLLLLLVQSASSASNAAPMTVWMPAEFSILNGAFPGDSQPSIVGTFTPFDTSLGTLLSVTPAFGGGSATAGVSLYDLLPGNYGFTVFFGFSFLGPDGVELGRIESAYGGFGFTIFDDGSSNLPPGFDLGIPFDVYVNDGNSLAFPFNQGITSGLDYFQTPNQFEISVESWLRLSGPSFEGGSVVRPPDTFGVQMGVSGISYTYEPVPEPSTALLVGIGLAVIGAGRSRRMA